MDEKLIIALVAASSAIVGGLITSVLGPVIKHGLEQSSVKKSRQREQIQKWRNMVIQVDRETDGSIDVGAALQVHPDFLTLEPYLTEEANRAVHAPNRTAVFGSTLQAPLSNMSTEISRVEKEWGLRQ
jgi:hypothetical protein